MKAPAADRSHVTKEGIQSLLDFWLYGILKSTSELGTAGLFLRRTEEEAVSRFIETERMHLGRARDPEQAIRSYLRVLDERGIMDERDVSLHRDGDRVGLEIGPLCPYRTVCGWINAEKPLQRCFRAIAFAEFLRGCTGRHYEGTLDAFGLPCQVTLAPSRIEVG